MTEIPEEIPEHHSALQHIMNKYYGKDYKPLHSLDEARQHPETAFVILEGDWGGIIYATCPVKRLRADITHDELEATCRKVEHEFWGYVTGRAPKEVPQDGGWGVYYQHHDVGSGVWGGCGGGRTTDGLWLHSKLQENHLQEIKHTIFGNQEK